MVAARRFLKGMLWGAVMAVFVGDFIKLPGTAIQAFVWVFMGSVLGGALRLAFGSDE